ncbi:MAG: cell division protein FtsQ/DivIB [candidate division WOR-3 bacterium]
MGKKKKLKFRLRYILIIGLIYFLYKIGPFSFKIKNAEVSYRGMVSKEKQAEVSGIIKRIELDNLKELKDSLVNLSWIKSVKMEKSLLGKLKINLIPREPIGKIAGQNSTFIDKEGVTFKNADNIENLPIIKIEKRLSKEELARAIKILEFPELSKIKNLEIKKKEIKTELPNFIVLWDTQEFEKEYKILKAILKKKENNLKGTIDLRFKNMAILRR